MHIICSLIREINTIYILCYYIKINFMTYNRINNKNNTTSATCGEETVYPSGAHGLPPLFIFLVCCVVLLCVFSFWVPCCDVGYDFRIQSLPPVVCSRTHAMRLYVVRLCNRRIAANVWVDKGIHFVIECGLFEWMRISTGYFNICLSLYCCWRWHCQ
jgi:hypothetical protein